MNGTTNNTLSAKDVAYIALTTALLIGGQAALYGVHVEVVTVLLLSFSYVFGPKKGALTATAFSLLRNFVFGFYFNVLILYLIYFNLFALLCGLCGRIKGDGLKIFLFHLFFLLIAAACVYFFIHPLAISVLKKKFVQTMFRVIFVLAILAILLFDALPLICKIPPLKKRGLEQMRTTFFMTSLACVCTVCFTLLDDALTPFFYAYGRDAAYAYFVSSFLAMLPQTVSAFFTVSVLFYPLTKIFSMFEKSFVKQRRL